MHFSNNIIIIGTQSPAVDRVMSPCSVEGSMMSWCFYDAEN